VYHIVVFMLFISNTTCINICYQEEIERLWKNKKNWKWPELRLRSDVNLELFQLCKNKKIKIFACPATFTKYWPPSTSRRSHDNWQWRKLYSITITQELGLHVIFTWIKFTVIASGQLSWQIYSIKRNVHVSQV
jgi:hypothetical protein